MELNSIFFLTFSLVARLVSGYSLNHNNLEDGLLKGGDGLFGWSMVHHHQSLYVGAPLADGSGRVIRCQDIDTRPTCSQGSINPSQSPKTGAWFGGSLTASQDSLFACAFRYNWQNWVPNGLQVGKCYKKDSKQGQFNTYFDFTRRFDVVKDNVWMKTGFYGVSVTVNQDGNLVVGNPLLYTQYGYSNKPNKFNVGSIGMIIKKTLPGGRLLSFKRPRGRDVAWATKEEFNNYKFAGYAVSSGQSRNLGGIIILGAPKADNFRGKVYVCINCFTDRVRYNQLTGTNLGEHFGSSVAACDFTGDGNDDLVVGAPNYAKDRNSFSSGRVHVFMEKDNKYQRVRPSSDSYLTPPVRMRDARNARFGSSVACLGNTDQTDGSKKVIVGAPYYEDNGAVFVYRYKNKLVLSQTIKSPGVASRGFGLKLSDPQVSTKNGKTLTTGIAVGGPENSRAYYIRVKPVPRLRDYSWLEISPSTIDPNRTKTISLTVKPYIIRVPVKLNIRGTVKTDNRLRLINSQSVVQTIFSSGQIIAEDLIFKFSLNLGNEPLRPVDFRVSLEYFLDECKDSYRNPCPIFDSQDETANQIPDNDGMKITKTFPNKRLHFNICKNPDGCLCEVGADVEPTTQIVAGEDQMIRLGMLRLENSMSEPSPTTTVEVTYDAESFRFKRIGNCGPDGNVTTCNIFLKKMDKVDLDLLIAPQSPIEPHVEKIKLTIKVTANCLNKESLILTKDLNVKVVQSYVLMPKQDPSQEEGKEITWSHDSVDGPLHRDLNYDITNNGPSISTPTRVYIYLPRHDLIQKGKVTFANEDCPQGDTERKIQRPPVLRSSSDEDIESVACTRRGDCLVYQCPVPQLQKFDSKKLRVSFEFNTSLAEQESVARFEVATSICVLKGGDDDDDDDEIICVGTGETLTTRTVFRYFQQSPLDVLIDYWQVVVAVGAALIVFIIVLILAWYFDLFQRVRFVQKSLNVDPQTNASPVETETQLN